MTNSEFFLIQPRDTFHTRIDRFGVDFAEEFAQATIWSQSFDLRTTEYSNEELLIETSVKLRFLAYAASQLDSAFDGVDELTPEIFDQYWTIQWIRGGMIENGEVGGDIRADVVKRITLGSKVYDSSLANPLTEILVKMRNQFTL